MSAPQQGELECFGPAPISSQGQITIPKPAREAVGLDKSDRVFVFAERGSGQILLTHEPLAQDVLDLAAKAARRKRGPRA